MTNLFAKLFEHAPLFGRVLVLGMSRIPVQRMITHVVDHLLFHRMICSHSDRLRLRSRVTKSRQQRPRRWRVLPIEVNTIRVKTIEMPGNSVQMAMTRTGVARTDGGNGRSVEEEWAKVGGVETVALRRGVLLVTKCKDEMATDKQSVSAVAVRGRK
jgi:hypothetical protein